MIVEWWSTVTKEVMLYTKEKVLGKKAGCQVQGTICDCQMSQVLLLLLLFWV